MEFKEPKVEVIKLNKNNVVFASAGAGTEYCKSTGSTSTDITTCPDSIVD